MYYADYKKFDFLNGLGLRHSLFVSGCTHHCYDCFNKVAWNFTYGKLFDEKIQKQIINDLNIKNINISGLSLLGGEPFDNAKDLSYFIIKVKEQCPNKNIWVWSGYTYEQILQDENKLKLLKLCDVLVDGKFKKELKDLTLKFRGSSNQRIIDIQESLKQNEVILYNL